MLDKLFDTQNVIPDDFNSENEGDYFGLLHSKEIGKVITNISEFLLETEGIQGKSKVNYVL